MLFHIEDVAHRRARSVLSLADEAFLSFLGKAHRRGCRYADFIGPYSDSSLNIEQLLAWIDDFRSLLSGPAVPEEEFTPAERAVGWQAWELASEALHVGGHLVIQLVRETLGVALPVVPRASSIADRRGEVVLIRTRVGRYHAAQVLGQFMNGRGWVIVVSHSSGYPGDREWLDAALEWGDEDFVVTTELPPSDGGPWLSLGTRPLSVEVQMPVHLDIFGGGRTARQIQLVDHTGMRRRLASASEAESVGWFSGFHPVGLERELTCLNDSGMPGDRLERFRAKNVPAERDYFDPVDEPPLTPVVTQGMSTDERTAVVTELLAIRAAAGSWFTRSSVSAPLVEHGTPTPLG